LTFPRQEATKLYKGELNPKIKERLLLLILRVKDDGILPAHAADELHRSRPWALYWLDRFSKEGVGGLKDRSKTGRPPKIPEELAMRIRTKLLESKQAGMDYYKTGKGNDIHGKWSKILPLHSHM
jgi:putative transposase